MNLDDLFVPQVHHRYRDELEVLNLSQLHMGFSYQMFHRCLNGYHRFLPQFEKRLDDLINKTRVRQ